MNRDALIDMNSRVKKYYFHAVLNSRWTHIRKKIKIKPVSPKIRYSVVYKRYEGLLGNLWGLQKADHYASGVSSWRDEVVLTTPLSRRHCAASDELTARWGGLIVLLSLTDTTLPYITTHKSPSKHHDTLKSKHYNVWIKRKLKVSCQMSTNMKINDKLSHHNFILKLKLKLLISYLTLLKGECP